MPDKMQANVMKARPAITLSHTPVVSLPDTHLKSLHTVVPTPVMHVRHRPVATVIPSPTVQNLCNKN